MAETTSSGPMVAPLDASMAEVKLDVATTTEDEDEVSSSTDETSLSDSSLDEEDAAVPRRPTIELPTGLCYDPRMRFHSEICALSSDAVHPEDPRRIYYIFRELCQAGLAVDPAHPSTLMVSQPLKRIAAREVTRDEVLLVHTPELWSFVSSTADMSNDDLILLSDSDTMDSLYFNKLTFYSACLSAGGAIETCLAVVRGEVKNAIAVIRPPGHHAEPGNAMGFCLFDNVCVAARVVQRESIQNVGSDGVGAAGRRESGVEGLNGGTNGEGRQCRKVMILDWDVHHGNGVQKAFYEDPNVLYISLHVHKGGKFYPSGPEGGMDRVGSGAGLGYNVNIPWEYQGMGDGDYMYAFQHVVMPIAVAFDPDLVIVAAGFDAAAGDELGGCNVSPACYAHMTHMLMSLAHGRIAVCLEGGYNFRAISKSALAVTRTLMGEPPDRLSATRPTEGAVRVIEQVKEIHSTYWPCMYPKQAQFGIFGGERLHDIIRQYQAAHLFDEYKLTELFIHRSTISASFKQQVLASMNYSGRKHLLVVFHDPPDLLSNHDPISGTQRASDTWMLDGTQAYIHQAITLNMGVIDVNIPDHISTPLKTVINTVPYATIPSSHLDPSQNINIQTHILESFTSRTSDAARIEASNLALYLWENYIEPFSFPGGVWLLGAGHAFDAVTRLLIDISRVHARIAGVIGFVSRNHPIRAVNSDNDLSLSTWFRDSSRIFVHKDHELVASFKGRERKIPRRYGRIVPVPAPTTNNQKPRVAEYNDYQTTSTTVSTDMPINAMMKQCINSAFTYIRETQAYPDEDTVNGETWKPLPADVEDAEDDDMKGKMDVDSEEERMKIHASIMTSPNAGLNTSKSPGMGTGSPLTKQQARESGKMTGRKTTRTFGTGVSPTNPGQGSASTKVETKSSPRAGDIAAGPSTSRSVNTSRVGTPSTVAQASGNLRRVMASPVPEAQTQRQVTSPRTALDRRATGAEAASQMRAPQASTPVAISGSVPTAITGSAPMFSAHIQPPTPSIEQDESHDNGPINSVDSDIDIGDDASGEDERDMNDAERDLDGARQGQGATEHFDTPMER